MGCVLLQMSGTGQSLCGQFGIGMRSGRAGVSWRWGSSSTWQGISALGTAATPSSELRGGFHRAHSWTGTQLSGYLSLLWPAPLSRVKLTRPGCPGPDIVVTFLVLVGFP